MRIFKNIVIALSIPAVLLTAFFVFVDFSNRQAPVITCTESGDLVVKTSCTDEDLLKFVTAKDDKDGDISDKIVVQRKTYFVEKGRTIVTFAVCDSDNNVSKLKKNLVFEDYDSPQINLMDDLIIYKGTTVSIPSLFKAHDSFEGDISHKLKIISPMYNYSIPDTYTINCKVTNTFGDTREITLDIIVTDEDYSNVEIELNSYLVYAKVGEQIDFSSYIRGVVNKKSTDYTVDDVKVDAAGCDIQTPGTYNVFFSIGSSENTVSKTRLVVVVEE